MNQKFIYSLYVAIVFFISTNQVVYAVEKLHIDPTVSYQTIDGFGASDCWTVNYVGKYWDLAEKEKAAKWLFSTKVDKSGNPEGIGLSIWRVNLGAGTLEQGSKSTIKDITRRAESFLDENGNYDWTKQAGQQWFFANAKRHGCKSFVVFSNSPPLIYTRNGFGFSPGDGNANLKPECYDSFANYLVDVAKFLSKKYGVSIDYISPANEPQWNWDGDYQEGSPWQNSELKKIAVALEKALLNKNFKSTIMVTEAAKWDFLYKNDGRASNQISAFYCPKSEFYIGDLKNVKPLVGAHSYWTDRANDTLKQVRIDASKKAKEYNVELEQTEWSMLSVPPIDNFAPSFNDASYTDIALQMAKVIYADLAYANVRSWTFWTSMDVEMYGFKNRFNLIRLHTKGDSTGTIAAGGTVSAMKNLWMLGNYSHFVRPGFKRIQLADADDLDGLMGLSFISPNNKRIVSVLTNISYKSKIIALSMPNYWARDLKTSIYLTDSERDLSPQNLSNNSEIVLQPRSVTTIVYDFR